MKRNILFQILILLSLFVIGCQSMRQLTSSFDQDRALKRLKRGKLSSDGLYRNEIYEFEMRLPKNWEGAIGDPPLVLKGKPPKKEILDSYARKFIDISVFVGNIQTNTDIDTVIDMYRKRHQFELVLERPVKFHNASAKKCIFYGKIKDQSIKVLTLIVIHSDKEIILQCQALKPLFDNVEAQFDYSLRSFKITAKYEKEKKRKTDEKTFDKSKDYFIYRAHLNDTFNKLAKKYLGDEKRGDIIKEFNGIEVLQENQEIKIPRYLIYKIQKGDTYTSISKNILQDESYADWIKIYNQNTFGKVGETLYIPLYLLELLENEINYSSIAQKYYQDASLADFIKTYNNNKTLKKGLSIKLPIFLKKKYYLYTVESGDSLALIAKWLTGNAMKYLDIAKFNGIPKPYKLSVGQVLKIPADLIKDPAVFRSPKPKIKFKPVAGTSAAKKQENGKSKENEEKQMLPTATPEPIPLEEQDIYEID